MSIVPYSQDISPYTSQLPLRYRIFEYPEHHVPPYLYPSNMDRTTFYSVYNPGNYWVWPSEE